MNIFVTVSFDEKARFGTFQRFIHVVSFRKSLGTRVKEGEESGAIQERSTAFGNMELTFKLQKVSVVALNKLRISFLLPFLVCFVCIVFNITCLVYILNCNMYTLYLSLCHVIC